MPTTVTRTQKALLTAATCSALLAASATAAPPAKRRALAFDGQRDHLTAALATPLEADLTLEGTSGGVFVRGGVRATVEHICHRCLTEWQVPVAMEMAELVGGEGDYPMDGDEIDLEDPVRDALLLSLPLLPQCREDCLGLCSVCGADLNTGSCPGHDDEPEGPFSALRNLLEP